jgi:hypothetical protein
MSHRQFFTCADSLACPQGLAPSALSTGMFFLYHLIDSVYSSALGILVYIACPSIVFSHRRFFVAVLQHLSNHFMSSIQDEIRSRAARFQIFVDDNVEGRFSLLSLSEKLRLGGASPEEAQDYLAQAKNRIARASRFQENRLPTPGPSGTAHDDETLASSEEQPVQRGDKGKGRCPTPSEHSDGGSDEGDQQERPEEMSPEKKKATADATAWAGINAQLRNEQSRSARPTVNVSSGGIGGARIPLVLPAPAMQPAILQHAPHLGYSFGAKHDPHLEETFRLRKAFSAEKACDDAIDLVQRTPIANPLPRPIWRDIMLDRFVAFDKLHAALDSGYDWNDEPKDFGGGYAIVKKDLYVSKKPVRLESEWTRVFNAWEGGVCRVYPHRVDELQEYRKLIMEMFQATPEDPSIAIKFDADIRERYAKGPFHMDDVATHRIPMLKQVFYSKDRSSTKRSGSSEGPPSKRVFSVCENWNLGKCVNTPCAFRRKHGLCSECGKDHRAKDVDACFSQLNARRRRPGGQGSGSRRGVGSTN